MLATAKPIRLFLAWFAMLLVAMANGALRDLVYGRYMSELAAHQASTATDMVLLGLIMRAYVRIYPPPCARHAVLVGLSWAALTIAFEFLFFHYIGGRSWTELLSNYNILAGRVWVLVPLWVAVAPYLFFRLRRARPRSTRT